MATTREDFPAFLHAVIEAAVFSQSKEDDGSRPVTAENLHPDCREEIEAHAKSFWLRSYYYLDAEKGKHAGDVRAFGHDFWFTTQEAGVGFWEEDDWPTYGETFDKLAKSYPSEMELFSTEQAEQWAEESLVGSGG